MFRDRRKKKLGEKIWDFFFALFVDYHNGSVIVGTVYDRESIFLHVQRSQKEKNLKKEREKNKKKNNPDPPTLNFLACYVIMRFFFLALSVGYIMVLTTQFLYAEGSWPKGISISRWN